MSKYSNGIIVDKELYEIIPPFPTENQRGGITAKARTTENVEVAVDSDTGKLYVEKTKIDNTLSNEGIAAEAKAVGDKITEINTDINALKLSSCNQELLSAILNKKPTVNTLDDFFKLQTTSDVYQTKVWKCAYNPSLICEKLGANAGLVCEPSTDTVEGRDDYADKIEFMWWRCNYTRDDYGNKVVTAIEGDESYSEDGTVDVGTIGMTFYYGYDKDSSDEYDMLSWSTKPNDELNLYPFTDSVMVDGTVRPYYILSAFPSSLGDDGLLHSQPYKKIARSQSYQNMMTAYAKKGTNARGAGISRNTFQIVFNLIKYANKSSQANFAGVTNWNIQYDAAVQRTEKDTYFPVTAAQATDLEVGCCVSVGYASNSSGTLNKDRGQSTIHSYADDVKILRIEDMTDGNKAVYLDIEEGFDTTPVALTDELSSPIIMSSMHAQTGETNNVISKHDGSAKSNTSGRHSYRIQGVEYALGAYIVASDTVTVFQSDYSKDVYVADKSTALSTAEATIKSTYKLIGNIPANTDGKGSNYWIGDISINPETGGWQPYAQSSSSSQGFCDYLYAGGTSTSGTREFLQGGDLGNGSLAGSVFLVCVHGLSVAGWGCSSAD